MPLSVILTRLITTVLLLLMPLFLFLSMLLSLGMADFPRARHANPNLPCWMRESFPLLWMFAGIKRKEGGDCDAAALARFSFASTKSRAEASRKYD